MFYEEYIKYIFSDGDIERYHRIILEDINKRQVALENFLIEANKRLENFKKLELEKKYCVVGRTYREGKNKCILLIIRYPDGTQRDERYSFSLISDMRKKLSELREKYSGVDWSGFTEEI